MVVHDKDALHRAPHPEVLIVVLQPLKASNNRRVFFRLGLLRAAFRSTVKLWRKTSRTTLDTPEREV